MRVLAMKKTLIILCIAVGSLIFLMTSFGVFAWWSVESHPVSSHAIQKINKGMGTEEVRNILGSPYKVYNKDDGQFSWVYGSSMQWYFFVVEFSKDEKVFKFYEDD
jgi:outer membrane protein assembly factor BamE (lipoprotein component of BamABCDE complex)